MNVFATPLGGRDPQVEKLCLKALRKKLFDRVTRLLARDEILTLKHCTLTIQLIAQ